MSNLKTFLGERPLVWIIPVVVFLALVIVSWMASRTPDSPFVYRI